MQRLTTVPPPTFFCGIIPLCNFQYRNGVCSITLILFEIISQNLVQYKARLDDVQSTLSGEATLPYLLVCRRVQQDLFLSLRLMLAQWRGIMQCLQRFYLVTANGGNLGTRNCKKIKAALGFIPYKFWHNVGLNSTNGS